MNEQRQSSRRRISDADLEFHEIIMFAAAMMMNRLERLYILMRREADPEDLELILNCFEDAIRIRDVTRTHLAKQKAVRSGRNEPPGEKGKR